MSATTSFDSSVAAPAKSEPELSQLPSLQYSRLNLTRADDFRVLKTVSIDATCIRCSLSVASLKEPPAYVALSYTWGSARLGDQVTAEKTRKIVCNDSTIAITENLWQALNLIHSGNGYLWVDAICINQDDLDEKAIQVAKMGQIYSKAYMVIVWLGPADGAADLAIHTTKDFCERYRTIEDPAHLVGGQSFWEKMNRKPFTNHEANALTHFFNRLWFERIWVLQEVVLATRVRVLCSTSEIVWDDLVTMSIYLFNSGHASAWHQLRSKALADPHVRPVAIAPMQMNLMRNGCMVGVMLDEETILSIDDLQDQETDVAFCKFLMLLILGGRLYQCGRPADKVFAPLALVLHKFLGTKSWNLMLPDYSKSVQQIYTEVTSLIIRTTSDLKLLTAVEDISQKSIQDLPSWVPDFSVLTANPLHSLKFRPKFDVTKGMDSSFSATIEGSRLATGAYWLDTVIQTGPHHDNTSILHTFKGSPSPFLSFALSMGDKYLTGEGAIMAFIRTFIADQLPAIHDERMLFSFNAYARYFLLGSEDMDDIIEHAKRVTGLQTLTEVLQAFSEYPQYLPSWPELDAIEARGPTPIPTFRQLILWAEILEDKSYFDEENEDRANVELARHLFQECHLSAIAFRRFFKGRQGYIGLMPQSAQIGDELWILPGCKSPCTLRPLGRNGEYRLLGEAYVHGIMYGELWNRELRPYQSSIVLT